MYNEKWQKHKKMYNLLEELGIPDPKKDSFYSNGGTVTEAALNAALEKVRELKKNEKA